MADPGKEDIKGKGLMYPEDSGTGEEVKAEEDKQCTSSQALDIDGKEPIDINSEDLSVLHTYARREGMQQNMPDLLQQQQEAYHNFQQINYRRNQSNEVDLSSLTPEDLSVYHQLSGRKENLGDFVKNQQHAFSLLEQNRNESTTGDSLSLNPGVKPMFNTCANNLGKPTNSFAELMRQLEEATDPFPGQVHDPKNAKGELSSSLSLGLGQAQEQDPTQLYDPNDSDLGIDYDFDEEDFFNAQEERLVELQIPHSNRLLIPYGLGSKIFLPLSQPDYHPREEILQLVGQRGRDWFMSLTYDHHEQAFIITRGYQEYLDYYHLRPMDTILIYKPVPQMHGNHFTIEHDIMPKLDLRPRFPDPPEFRENNFLFEIELGPWEVTFGRLVIPGELVRKYFNAVARMEFESGDYVMLMKLTDEMGKDWYVYIEFPSVSDEYMLVDGWMEYVDEKELVAKDVVRFYKHVTPSNPRHFLIRTVKKTEKDEKKTTSRTSIVLGKRSTYLREKKPQTSRKRPLLLIDAVFRAPRTRTLFQVTIPHANRLVIPYNLASEHFKPRASLEHQNQIREYNLHLLDQHGVSWDMNFVFYDDEDSYVIIRGWSQYVNMYGLRTDDLIRFVRPWNPRKNHFLIVHEKEQLELNLDDYVDDDYSPHEGTAIPLFLPDRVVLEVTLSPEDIELGRLGTGWRDFPLECQRRELVRLTDENGKAWYLVLACTGEDMEHKYMILDGFEEFLNEHGLEAGDVVVFYTPEFKEHDRHLLIRCVKKKKKENQQGTSQGGGGSC